MVKISDLGLGFHLESNFEYGQIVRENCILQHERFGNLKTNTIHGNFFIDFTHFK